MQLFESKEVILFYAMMKKTETARDTVAPGSWYAIDERFNIGTDVLRHGRIENVFG